MTESTETIDVSEKPPTRKSPERRVQEAADDAIALAGNDFEEALRLFLGVVTKDAATLLVTVSASHLRADAANHLRDAKVRADGKVSVSSHVRSRPGGAKGEANGADGQSKPGGDGKTTAGPESPETATQGPSAADRDAGKKVARRLANSLLDTFLINGTPIRYRTKSECEAWARGRKKDAAFVLALVQGLPTPEAVVNDYLDENDAERAMEAALKSREAA